jgi:hypothetical protein
VPFICTTSNDCSTLATKKEKKVLEKSVKNTDGFFFVVLSEKIATRPLAQRFRRFTWV